MRVGVVICTLGRKELSQAVTALTSQPFDRLLIVRDYQGNLSRARNEGWKSLVDCDVIAFTDDDCIPDKNFVREGKKFFENNWVDFMQGKVTGGINTSNDFFFVGANYWVKISALKKLDGFDENFLYAGGYEDVEFGWRLERAGGTVAYNPKCIVEHPTAANHKTLSRNMAILAKRFPERFIKMATENTAR